MASDVTIGIFVLVLLLLFIGPSFSLKCWHCIADDCDQTPSGNYKASTRTCQKGESCQKVYYRALSLSEEKMYDSTVRSCSVGECVTQDDFRNCSAEQLTSPGCVRKFCCNDKDLCNTAVRWTSNHMIFVSLYLSFFFLQFLLLPCVHH